MCDLTADFPPPHDDEPPSLRRDIVDELADHLQCALHRELLRGGSSGPCETASGSADSSFRTDPHSDSSLRTAHEHVLARFGNPAAVAHRLWLDAMKEKLMAQRIMTAASLVAAIAACVMVLFVWRSMDADRQVVLASLDANRDLISQVNAANTRLMDQLDLSRQKLEQLSAGGSQNVEWMPAAIDIRQGTEDGPPAPNVEVQFISSYKAFGARSSIPSESQVPPISRRTDEDGHADLGLVRFGQYTIRLKMPWNEYSVEDVAVHPGKPFSRVIVVPARPLDPIKVAVRVQWPDGFEHDDIWVVFWRNSMTRQLAGLTWYTRDPWLASRSSEPKAVIVSPDGRFGLFDAEWSEERNLVIGSESIEIMPLDIAAIQPINQIQLPDAEYRFENISFLIRVAGAAADVPRSADDRPFVAYVPDTYLNNASGLLKLTNDASQLTLMVPANVVDKIREFRAMMRTGEHAVANQD